MTIEDVHMQMSVNYFVSPLSISDNSNVKLILVGTNTFKSSGDDVAGIQISSSENSSLEITSYTDGSVYAYGGVRAAGIGGASGLSGSASTSNITISGGYVYAKGGNFAAGIGGGAYGYVDNITIYSSASVTAVAGNMPGFQSGTGYAGYNIGTGGYYYGFDKETNVTFIGWDEEEYDGCITKHGSCTLEANTSVTLPEADTCGITVEETETEIEPALAQVIIVDTASK